MGGATATATLLVLGALLVSGCSADRPPRARGEVAARASAAQPEPAAPAGLVVAPLVPGESREGDLAGGEQRIYPVELAAGDYARFYAGQRLPGDSGVDLVVTLLAPDGAKVNEVDSPGGAAGGELLSAVVANGGIFHLVLTTADPEASRGRFTLKLDERRAGKPGDAERVSAERLINEASQLRTAEAEEADSEALEKLAQALALVGEAGDPSLDGDARMLIGQIHLTRGSLDAARASYGQALAAYDRAGDSHRKAIVFLDLGLTSKRLGNIEEALEYYRAALPILSEVGDVAEEANTYHSMGVAAMSLGNLEEAKDWLSQALDLWNENRDSEGEATALITLSRLELRRGRVDEASSYLEDAVKLARDAGARTTRSYGLSLLAGIRRLRGDFQGALSVYQTVLEINRRTGNSREEARVLNNIGVVYLDLGALDLARFSFDQALGISTRFGLKDSEVQALCNLGWLVAKQRDPQGALAYLERAVPISRQLSDPLWEAMSLRLMGGALFNLGRLDDAIEMLDRALMIQQEQARDRVREAYTRVSLGNVLLARGDLTRARGHFDQALQLSRELQIRLTESEARLGIARVEEARGNLAQSLEEIELAVRIYERLRTGVSSDYQRNTFFTGSRAYYEFYLDLLMEMERREPNSGYASAALEVSERMRARGLLDLLAEGHVDLLASIAPEARAEERSLQGRISQTERLISETLYGKSEGRTGSVDELRAELQGLEDELRRLDSRIQGQSRRYAQLRNPAPIGVAEVQALLDDKQAFLEFSLGARNSYLFVVTRSSLSTFTLPASAEIQEEVNAFRAAVVSSDRRARGAYILAAQRLYELLLAPADVSFARKSELLIAPDGVLYFLPFETLLAPGRLTNSWRELPYLIRQRAISYVPSASVLASLTSRRDTRSPGNGDEKLFVAFADPNYGEGGSAAPAAGGLLQPAGDGGFREGAGGSGTAQLPRLVESAREVKRIAGIFGTERSVIYLQEDATEKNVRSSPYLETAQWVHFATHGLIDEIQPQRTGLLLTPVVDEEDLSDDGILRVGEIFNLTLRADLVVLSACDTGLGKVVSGEGMVGLTRAFLYAGAESLVVSLWEVEDRSTADLMVAFKRRLDEKGDKAEALRRAKLDLITSDRAAAPRQWAAFVLVGDRS